MQDLKHFKRLLYCMIAFVKEMLNNWATKHSVMPKDWKELVLVVLEAGQQLQW